MNCPKDFKRIASTDNSPIAGMADEARGFYGLQFHPEVTHTHQGMAILRRFVCEIAGCDTLWTADNIITDAIADIRARVGADEVLLALSGGVDSAVTAALLQRAIGDQLTCIFVDTGLLRLNEGDQVMETFARHMGIRVIRVNAEQRYMDKLKGVADPEDKRKIIGREFIAIFEEEGKKLSNEKWLAQGTIYPDVIESAGAGTGKAHVIKSHHNVGGLPERMNLEADRTPARTLQGRSTQTGRTTGTATGNNPTPSVSGPGSGRADPRRGEKGIHRNPAPGR